MAPSLSASDDSESLISPPLPFVSVALNFDELLQQPLSAFTSAPITTAGGHLAAGQHPAEGEPLAVGRVPMMT